MSAFSWDACKMSVMLNRNRELTAIAISWRHLILMTGAWMVNTQIKCNSYLLVVYVRLYDLDLRPNSLALKLKGYHMGH